MTEIDKTYLVERLRLSGKVRADGGYSAPREKETMREAADEIERLRLQLARAHSVLRAVQNWSEQPCPCHDGDPDPCTLCGARADIDSCGALDGQFPPHLAMLIESAQTDDDPESTHDEPLRPYHSGRDRRTLAVGSPDEVFRLREQLERARELLEAAYWLIPDSLYQPVTKPAIKEFLAPTDDIGNSHE